LTGGKRKALARFNKKFLQIVNQSLFQIAFVVRIEKTA
jgi:hypothetical protein